MKETKAQLRQQITDLQTLVAQLRQSRADLIEAQAQLTRALIQANGL